MDHEGKKKGEEEEDERSRIEKRTVGPKPVGIERNENDG